MCSLKATKSASGIIGTFLGPRSPGSAYVLLHHYMGEIDGAFRSWGLSRGGTGAVSDAIAAAAREHGVDDLVLAAQRERDRCDDDAGAAFGSVGAFGLPGAASKDAALLVSLPPGNYSVQAAGAAGTTGVALVEVYEVP